VELGSAGVSTNIFNYVSKLFNIPLLSVATSFVAEDISKNAREDSASGEVQLMVDALTVSVELVFDSGFIINLGILLTQYLHVLY
jgi:hypothetical protein